ncbi:MAG: MFS transporter [Candidatus Bathyarchaeia archaeon]|nr:MFS transporter [Candidatus Bathyarchaeota archaeon]
MRLHKLHRKWIVFISSSLLYFLAYFHRVSATVIVEDLMRDFSASATSIGFLTSLYFYTYAAMQLPAGLLADSLGPRKTLTLFCLITGFGTLTFAVSSNLSMAMLGRTMIGLGVSVAFLSSAKLIASWFDVGSFASVTGLLVSIGNLGGLFASAPLAIMITGLGWRNSFLGIALSTFTLTLALWLLVEDDPSGVSKRYREVGLDDASKRSGDKLILSKGLIASIKNRNFWFAAFPPFFYFGSFISFQGLWGVPYLMQVYGFGRVEASGMVMLVALGFLTGASFWGFASDRIFHSRRMVYLLGSILFTLTWFMVTSPTIQSLRLNFWMSPLLFMMGFTFGVMPISIVIVKELYPWDMMGVATGCANAIPFIGIAIFQMLLGYYLDTYGLVKVSGGVRIFSPDSFHNGFTICLLTLIVAVALTSMLEETRR